MQGATLLKLTVIVALAAIGLGEIYDGAPAIAGPTASAKTPGGPVTPIPFEPVQKPRVADYSNSGCLVFDEDPPTWPCGEDEFVFTVEGDSLHAVHLNATYNCCPEDIIVCLQMHGDTIRLIEEEILPTPCDCDCCYNVESEVVNLAPGVYTLIYEWYDYETWEMRYYDAQIVVPDPDQPRVVDISSFGCLDDPEDPQFPPCGDDVINFAVLETGLHVLHENAMYNCCKDDIVILMDVEDGVIYLTEEEICPEPCYCNCCFTVDALIEGLASGDYVVEFCWYDLDTETTMCDVQNIIIP